MQEKGPSQDGSKDHSHSQVGPAGVHQEVRRQNYDPNGRSLRVARFIMSIKNMTEDEVKNCYRKVFDDYGDIKLRVYDASRTCCFETGLIGGVAGSLFPYV